MFNDIYLLEKVEKTNYIALNYIVHLRSSYSRRIIGVYALNEVEAIEKARNRINNDKRS